MNSINLIKILFSFLTVPTLLVGGLINLFEEKLPIVFRQTFRYGKFAYKGKATLIKPVEVPKVWFKHFYIFSSILSTIAVYFVIDTYIFNNPVSTSVLDLLDTIAGIGRKATVTPVAALVATILLTMQCYRRLHDTQFVSVFGNSNINLAHYLIGYLHYAGAIPAILVEAPNFTTTTMQFKWSDISTKEIVGSIIFIWAWWHQYVATKILASLRKNEIGKVVSKKHFLPAGDLFEYVSSPHLLCEILMYLSLNIILWSNSTFFYVFIWVLVNQVEVALLNHEWYKINFQKYPENRRILIPYVF